MTSEDYQRLAQIRMEVAKWVALNPEAADWDSAFLLRMLDAKVSR